MKQCTGDWDVGNLSKYSTSKPYLRISRYQVGICYYAYMVLKWSTYLKAATGTIWIFLTLTGAPQCITLQ